MTEAATVEKIWLRWREVDAALRLDEWMAELSDEERDRAAGFRFEDDRHSYVAAHAMVRRLLSELDPSVVPRAWRFTARADGKPEVDRRQFRDIDFSLSHTRGFAVCAAARAPLGADVEPIDCSDDLPRLAERLFAPNEIELLAKAPQAERRRLFIRLWTLKEAYLKATGEELSLPLDQVAFDLGPEPRIRRAGRSGAAEFWRCAELSPFPGFQIALVCQCGAMAIEARRYGDRRIEKIASGGLSCSPNFAQ